MANTIVTHQGETPVGGQSVAASFKILGYDISSPAFLPLGFVPTAAFLFDTDDLRMWWYVWGMITYREITNAVTKIRSRNLGGNSAHVSGNGTSHRVYYPSVSSGSMLIPRFPGEKDAFGNELSASGLEVYGVSTDGNVPGITDGDNLYLEIWR